jgi:hypothetical protein
VVVGRKITTSVDIEEINSGKKTVGNWLRWYLLALAVQGAKLREREKIQIQ